MEIRVYLRELESGKADIRPDGQTEPNAQAYL